MFYEFIFAVVTRTNYHSPVKQPFPAWYGLDAAYIKYTTRRNE
jgi:hypothetical protein